VPACRAGLRLNDVDEEQLKLIDKYYRCNSLFRTFLSLSLIAAPVVLFCRSRRMEKVSRALKVITGTSSFASALFCRSFAVLLFLSAPITTHVNADFSHFQLRGVESLMKTSLILSREEREEEESEKIGDKQARVIFCGYYELTVAEKFKKSFDFFLLDGAVCQLREKI
jgi:hypothetical protein